MKTFAWTVVLAAMLIPTVAWAQQGTGSGKGPEGNLPGSGGPDPAKAMADLQRQQMELEVEARKDDIQLQRERHKLEIEKQRAEIEMMRNRGDGRHHGPGPLGGLMALMLIGCLVSHILLTIWVCKDMREKCIGRALWVPIVLFTGPAGAILYAIVRLADTREQPAAPAAKGK
jgi:hypothetical protein